MTKPKSRREDVPEVDKAVQEANARRIESLFETIVWEEDYWSFKEAVKHAGQLGLLAIPFAKRVMERCDEVS